MYIFYVAMLEKDHFFQRNRFFLLGSVLLALLLPLCEWNWVNVSAQNNSNIFLKTLKLDVLFPDIINQKTAFQPISTNSWRFSDIIWIMYVCICIFLVLRLVWQILYLFFWINNAKKNYQRGFVRIDTEGKMPTFSFFNFLFWDNTQDLNEQEKDQILHHEQKHIWDRHTYDVIFLELAKIIWFFNPIIYLIYYDLRLQHEYLADASVLRESSIKNYAKTLVKIVFQRNNLPLVHSFNQQEIKNRLLVMQENAKSQEMDILTENNISSFQNPKDFYKILWVIPLVLVFFWAFAGEIKADLRAENRFVQVKGGLDNFYIQLEKEILKEKLKTQKKNQETGQKIEIPNLKGKVFVEFAVNKNGKLSEFKIIKSLHPIYDKWVLEALQKVDNMQWLPAKIQGTIVKQKIALPVIF